MQPTAQSLQPHKCSQSSCMKGSTSKKLPSPRAGHYKLGDFESQNDQKFSHKEQEFSKFSNQNWLNITR